MTYRVSDVDLKGGEEDGGSVAQSTQGVLHVAFQEALGGVGGWVGGWVGDRRK